MPLVPHTAQQKGHTPLHVATKAEFFIHCTQRFRTLLPKDVEEGVMEPHNVLRLRNVEKDRTFHEAVQAGHLPSAVLLTNADPGLLCLVNNAKQSPLYLAPREGSLEIMQQILVVRDKSISVIEDNS
ncbi:hypothetical protein ACLOJK_033154 [Asimina triloba]